MKKINGLISVKKITSMKVDGYARDIHEPQSEEEFVFTIKKFLKNQDNFFVIGKGSNVIFAEEVFDGTIIRNIHACDKIYITETRGLHFFKKIYLYAGSSVPLQKLIRYCIDNNLEAPTFLQSVPGNVGGALVMNAGTGVEKSLFVDKFVHKVKVFDGKSIFFLNHPECEFSYRSSIFQKTKNLFVLGAIFCFRKKNGNVSRKEVKERLLFTKEKQDHSFPNSGSIFNLNFIDLPQIRGKKIGGAMFSKKTPNWILNVENAKFSDVENLIKLALQEHSRLNLPLPKQEIKLLKNP